MEVVYPQLWIFDFDSSTWSCIGAAGGAKPAGKNQSSGSSGVGRGGVSSSEGAGPPAVFDHTATLAGRAHIIVIGGVMVGRALNSEVSQTNLLCFQV